MDRSIDSGISNLTDKILQMGGLVEKMIEEATQALVAGDPKRFEVVYEREVTINQLQIEIDDLCLKLLATQAPMAMDLRMVMAVIKINNDLERLGDQAVNIAYNGKEYMRATPIKPLVDIPRMAEIGRKMLKEALDSFVHRDRHVAENVLLQDDELDELKDHVFHDLSALMAQAPATIPQALSLILIARNLERIGDHATNIAEDVIFVVSGEDVRHSSQL